MGGVMDRNFRTYPTPLVTSELCLMGLCSSATTLKLGKYIIKVSSICNANATTKYRPDYMKNKSNEELKFHF